MNMNFSSELPTLGRRSNNIQHSRITVLFFYGNTAQFIAAPQGNFNRSGFVAKILKYIKYSRIFALHDVG